MAGGADRRTLGMPVAVTSMTAVEGSDGVETGIWECAPGVLATPLIGSPLAKSAVDEVSPKYTATSDHP